MRIRWHFSLRAFVAVITIGCLCLGGWVTYQRHWIALRHAALATDGIQGNPSSKHNIYVLPYSPNGLWVFGEPGQSQINVATSMISKTRIAELRELFPEAAFFLLNDGRPPTRLPALNP